MKKYFKKKHILILGLATFSALLVYAQGVRVLPLVDVTYQLSNAYRLNLGQMPYVDFDLVLTPGTYYVMKWILDLFGPQYLNQILLVALTQSINIMLFYKVLKGFSDDYWIVFSACVVVALTGFVIYAHPAYDIFASFFVLISIYYAQILFKKDKSPIHFFVLGNFIFLPFVFKQNVGMIYIIIMFVTLGSLLWFSTDLKKRSKLVGLSLGLFFTSTAFITWLCSFGAFHDFYAQTFLHAGKMRNVFDQASYVLISYVAIQYIPFYLPVIAIMFLLWEKKNRVKNTFQNYYINNTILLFVKYMLPISLIVVFILTPIIGFLVSEKFQNSFIQSSLNYYSGVWPLVISLSIICLVISIVSGNFRKNSFETFLCIPIIVTMNAAFLSQGFYGSSYSLWPLWAILLVIIFNVLRKIKVIEHLRSSILFIIFCMIFAHMVEGYKNSRLGFVNLKGSTEVSQSNYLKHLSTPGDWLKNLDKILNFIKTEIPKDDKYLSIPGEDPLHFLSDRVHPLKYFQFNSITLMHDLDRVRKDILDNEVNWIIVKTETQSPGAYIEYEELLNSLRSEFWMYKNIDKYQVYKKY
ncbi:hypothetical protein N9K21_04540 [Amylibacter sp.]|nr:hypothetical protein [Amylibacter sp.]